MHELSSSAARLAQSVEHQTFNLRVKGSSPLLGDILYKIYLHASLVDFGRLKNHAARNSRKSPEKTR